MISLHQACKENNKSLIKLIIAKGKIDINAIIDHKTPLHIAIVYNSEEIIKLLIDNGADVNKKNSNQDTPLNIACNYKFGKIIKLLVNNGANLSEMNCYEKVSETLWKDGYKDIIKSYHNASEIIYNDKISSNLDPFLITKSGSIIDIYNNEIIQQIKINDSYLQVKLGNQLYLVHILVANTFKPNKDKTLIVKHKDNNILNNHIDNLEWDKIKIYNDESFCNIKFLEIPEFLYDSELYKNCLESGDDFNIKKKYYKNDLIINSIDDFIHLLYTLRFWCINEIPYTVYNYILNNKTIIEIYYNLLQYIFYDFLFLDDFKILFRYNKENILGNCTNNKFYLNYLKYARENSYYNIKACYYASLNGFLDCLKYAHENGFPLDEGTCSNAALNGHIDCLKYAHENGFPLDEGTCSNASLNGHLDCLKYAHENGFLLDTDTCNFASLNGHLEVLKYAHKNGFPFYSNTCSSAAINGHLDCLKYAHENGCKWYIFTCAYAAKNGHLACLKYAHENNCEWNYFTTQNAIRYGHLEILKYLHENNCPWDKNGSPWDEWTCREAAENGHLEILKYLHENGCPWNEWTCSVASLNGHLAILKYAHENGCNWNSDTCRYAIKNNHLAILKYAYENGCIIDNIAYLDIMKYDIL